MPAPAFTTLARLAIRYGPVAKEGLDRAREKVEPAVRAYLLAQQVDGYIVDWQASEGHYQFVLDRDQRRVVDSFPRSAPHLHDAVLAGAPEKRVHHRDHWVHKVRERARRAGELPRRAIAKAKPPYGDPPPLWEDD